MYHVDGKSHHNIIANSKNDINELSLIIMTANCASHCAKPPETVDNSLRCDHGGFK